MCILCMTPGGSVDHTLSTAVLYLSNPSLFSFKVKNPPLEPSSFVSVPPKQPDKMGFDEVLTLTQPHTYIFYPKLKLDLSYFFLHLHAFRYS